MKVYVETAPKIRAKILGQLRADFAECEDIVSTIFLDLWVQIAKDKFKGDAKLETFLYTIMKRRVTDHIRNKYKEQKITAFNKEKIMAGRSHKLLTPEEELNKKELYDLLHELIKFLTPRQEELFELMLKGYEVSEAAASMNISARTANSHYRHALIRLCRILKQRSGCG